MQAYPFFFLLFLLMLGKAMYDEIGMRPFIDDNTNREVVHKRYKKAQKKRADKCRLQEKVRRLKEEDIKKLEELKKIKDKKRKNNL